MSPYPKMNPESICFHDPINGSSNYSSAVMAAHTRWFHVNRLYIS
jgi:hypothetical protein